MGDGQEPDIELFVKVRKNLALEYAEVKAFLWSSEALVMSV